MIINQLRMAVSQLTHVARVRNPDNLRYQIVEAAELHAGQIAILSGGQFLVPNEAISAVKRLLEEAGIKREPPNGSDPEEHAKFLILTKTGLSDNDIELFAAKWYVDLWCKVHKEDNPGVPVLEALNQYDSGCDIVYRGEADRFPSTTSTLARAWNTRNADALKMISRNISWRVRQYTGIKTDDTTLLMAELQHMSGETNLVDFSRDKWVALFFAVGTELHAKSHGETTGVVWALNPKSMPKGLVLKDLTNYKIGEDKRWHRQAGVVIIPDNGEVPRTALEEVIRIQPEQKEAVRKFLNTIGINPNTLFPDLEGYIRYEQGFAPLEALVHIALDHLRIGNKQGVQQASGIANGLARHDGPINQEAGIYLQGLVHAYLGELNEAYGKLSEYCNRRTLDSSEIALKNLNIVKETLMANGHRNYGKKKRREARQLWAKIDLTAEETLWSIRVGTYTRVSTD